MYIPCPNCGPRDANEFAYRGDAAHHRPENAGDMTEYVYFRDNSAGMIDEYWYHSQGCRNWLVVRRDTRTHVIESSQLARDFRS